jgi:hypothetical protein
MERHANKLGILVAVLLAWTSGTAVGQEPASPPPETAVEAPPPEPTYVTAAEPPPTVQVTTLSTTRADTAVLSTREEESPSFLVDYDMSMPVGGLRDFIRDPSWSGIDLTNPWPVWRSLFVGPAFSYHMFDQHDQSSYGLDTGAITGTVYRYAHFFSLAAMVRYVFLKPGDIFRPYVGGRLGAEFVSTTAMVADFSRSDDDVGFMMGGEGGVLVRLFRALRFQAGIRNTFTTAKIQDSRLSYISFQAGLMLSPEGA